MTDAPRRRFGFKRWIVLGLIFLGGVLAFAAPSWGGHWGIFKPTSPAVSLPGEIVWPEAYILPDIPALGIKELPLTNTLLATLITDLVLLAIVFFSVQRFVRGGQLVPQGFYNFFEFLVEFLWNTTESAAGKWARRMFPFMATIFMLVFVGNMIKLVPGFESIGWLKEAHEKGYAKVQLFGSVYAIDGTRPVEAKPGETSAGSGEEEEAKFCESACEVVPFLRGSATDLNFTFALAVIAVVMIQVFGVWALGARYFGKFLNTGGMISKPVFGFIDFLVGLLEIVSEFAKILSFGFRLFGNIFAGALLLSILGALTAIIVPSMLYALEIFVGLIQAYVFAMLALVFMSQAVVSHHGDEHAEPAAAH